MNNSRNKLFAILALAGVLTGGIVLSLLFSNRAQDDVVKDEIAQDEVLQDKVVQKYVQPVREDPYVGIDAEFEQAVNDMHLSRDPQKLARAQEMIIAAAKEIESNLDAKKGVIKQEFQDKTFEERLKDSVRRLYNYTDRERVELVFTVEDLPQLYATLDEPKRARLWSKAATAIAILEPDKEKAFKTVYEFIHRKEDWETLIKFHSGYTKSIATDQYTAVSLLSYINSDKANEFLLQHLEKEKARELGLKLVERDAIRYLALRAKVYEEIPMEKPLEREMELADIRSGILDEFTCHLMVLARVANGIVQSGNEELIDHLIDAAVKAEETEYEESKEFPYRSSYSTLSSNLVDHYYYKDHGLKGGRRIASIMHVPIDSGWCDMPGTYYDEYRRKCYVPIVDELVRERGLITE